MRPLPPRIESARRRIEEAVSEIEAAVARKDVASVNDPGLSPNVEGVRTENAALREAHEDAARRVDAAINRLRVILKG